MTCVCCNQEKPILDKHVRYNAQGPCCEDCSRLPLLLIPELTKAAKCAEDKGDTGTYADGLRDAIRVLCGTPAWIVFMQFHKDPKEINTYVRDVVS